MNSEAIKTAPDKDNIRAAERIYEAWDTALGRKDLEGALSLYAEDAVLESPLVRYILGGGGHHPGPGQAAGFRGRGLRPHPRVAPAPQDGLFHRWPQADLGISPCHPGGRAARIWSR
jgi:hypothetical protein